MARKTHEKDDQYILDKLKEYGIKKLNLALSAPAPPTLDSAEYLDYLDQHATEIILDHPGAPPIVKEGDRFILKRPEKRRARYKSMRSALRKLISELALKDDAARNAEQKG